MMCIVKNVHNHLVVAGAAGKTTTIVGKIKYILLGQYKAQDILVLSFTNKSTSEMGERISMKQE